MLYALLLTAPLCKAGSTASAPDAPTSQTNEAQPLAAGAPPAVEVGVDPDAATHCATSSALLGAGSSYSTTLMARRVMEQGNEWSKVAALTAATPDPETMVAAPFTLVEDATVRVLATQLIESLAADKNVGPRLQLAGKQMDVDGTRYVVLTSYRVVNP